MADAVRWAVIGLVALASGGGPRALASGGGAASAGEDWPQWGGARSNFEAAGARLAESWPAEGPRRIWERRLGDGYSAIAAVDGALYTMVRRGSQEAVVALDAADGKTLWEHAYEAELTDDMAMEFGPGPHATPAVTAERVFTVGVTCILSCVDRKTGEALWSVDLQEAYGAPHMGRGYGASPFAYDDVVVLPVGGGPGKSIVALRQADGSEAWSRHDFGAGYATAQLIELDGQAQLVLLMGKEVVGLDPRTGDLLWQHPHRTLQDANISTPVWDGKDRLFVSSAYNGGARGLRLRREGGATVVEELWANRKVQVMHGNAVEVDGYIYCSIGSFGPALLVAVDLASGEMVWRERGYGRATCVYGDGKLIFLDQDGKLVLARCTPQKLERLSECQLLERVAWTVPTLVGSTLYVRDRARIMALDVGPADEGKQAEAGTGAAVGR